MSQKIDIPMLKRLVKSTKPETEQEITDADQVGMLLKHLPSGAVRFYVQVARGRRETIAHAQGSGRRAVQREGEGKLYPVDATDVLDRNKPEISLTWVRKECARLKGTALDGTDRGAARQAQRSIPTCPRLHA